jgi:hypothetical protein
MWGPLFVIYNLLFAPAFGFCQWNIEPLSTHLTPTTGFVLSPPIDSVRLRKNYLCSFAEKLFSKLGLRKLGHKMWRRWRGFWQ